jgi:site-specific recombinase XerD
MGHFCDLLERQLQIRGRSEKTRSLYRRAMRDLVRHAKLPPDKITLEKVHAFQHHLVKERKLAESTFNVWTAGIRFFFRYVIQRDWKLDNVPYHKRSRRKLPEILSRQEVGSLFRSMVNLKHRAILMTVYSCGLRVSEAKNLRIADIDSQRMVVRIEQGKGRKDRYVMLSPRLLAVLREYYRRFRPKYWLFESEVTRGAMHVSTLQRVFHRAKVRCNIAKRVSIHSLRHAFATHLTESGINMRIIQKLLGHLSLSSTEIYSHVASDYLQKVHSPIDHVDSLLALTE